MTLNTARATTGGLQSLAHIAASTGWSGPVGGKPSVFLGIDPGISGALVVLGADGCVLVHHDTPILTVATTGRTKSGKVRSRSEYDVATMARLVREIVGRWAVRLVVIERVYAMQGRRAGRGASLTASGAPGEGEGRGTLAAVSLAESAGLWRGICAAHGLRVERVAPATWKAQLVPAVATPGVSRARASALRKERARLRALELFPGFAEHLIRKLDHGRAEAALLAEWGRRLDVTDRR